MRFSEKTCREFTEELAAKVSVPGGGGASALVGAVGAALGTMVGSFTVGKKKYADVEPEILSLMERAEDIRKKLLDLVDKDAEAFAALSEAYKLSKDDPSREETVEKCLRDAAGVPLEIMRLSCKAIELQREFSAKGSSMLISDAGTGVVFCWSAMYGAALNVKVNTKLMADRDYAASVNGEVDELMAKYRPIADEVYESVMKTVS